MIISILLVHLSCVMIYYVTFFIFFFFKQKTAYEMRISDWSSDVCSSDLGITWIGPTKTVGPLIIPAVPIQGWPIGETPITPTFQLPEKTPIGQIGRASCRERVCQYV